MPNFRVRLAVNRPAAALSARYDYIRAENASEAGQRAVTCAQDEFKVKGWIIEEVEEVEE